MNGQNSKGDVFRHRQASSNSSYVRTCAVKLRPLVGEVHYMQGMVRKPRIHFPGAFYHVIARGNRREKIFRNEKDYQLYLNFLSEYKERYGFSLYAYTLMPNHVHLLIAGIPI